MIGSNKSNKSVNLNNITIVKLVFLKLFTRLLHCIKWGGGDWGLGVEAIGRLGGHGRFWENLRM